MLDKIISYTVSVADILLFTVCLIAIDNTSNETHQAVIAISGTIIIIAVTFWLIVTKRK